MSLTFKPAPVTDEDKRAQQDDRAKERESLVAAQRLNALFGRLQQDTDFQELFMEGWLQGNIDDLDGLLDTCTLEELPNVRAQRKLLKKLKTTLGTEMASAVEKSGDIRRSLDELEKAGAESE